MLNIEDLRNEVKNSMTSIDECFKHNLISDTAIIRFLCVRDFELLHEAEPLRTKQSIYEELSYKYCISPLTVQLYHYKHITTLTTKSKARLVYRK